MQWLKEKSRLDTFNLTFYIEIILNTHTTHSHTHTHRKREREKHRGRKKEIYKDTCKHKRPHTNRHIHSHKH